MTSSATSVDTTTARPIEAVVFDIGGVLLDWDPRYLYRSLLPDETAVERFLAEVCTPSWNAAQDAGRDWDEAVASLTARFPEHADLIRAYHERWPEMVAGVFEDTAAILRELRAAGIPTYALTNFSAQKWEIAVERWGVLREFDGAVVSGKERVTKPDPAIYHRLVERYALTPERTFFTDDTPANVEAARRVGLRAELFVDADTLRAQLVAAGVLPSAAASAGQQAPRGGGPRTRGARAAEDGQVSPEQRGGADAPVATEADPR